MVKEEKWAFRYQTLNGEKVCYPGSKVQIDKNIKICMQKGFDVISIKKLYPFSLMKNQHNFNLISDICFNRMHDMESGEIEWNDEEYNRMSKLKERAEYFFCLPPIAWLPYEEWIEAKEIAQMAITHREETCIKNGRLDLLKYCD